MVKHIYDNDTYLEIILYILCVMDYMQMNGIYLSGGSKIKYDRILSVVLSKHGAVKVSMIDRRTLHIVRGTTILMTQYGGLL